MDAWTELALIDATTSRHHRPMSDAHARGGHGGPGRTPRATRDREERPAHHQWSWWHARRLAL
ncbi:hypothetical protein C1701_05845 [Actinoalloteichus sp. AHMU CJ021]|uniref:hypothetical protein n=1 Tax=Actinoalloteichus TaxID=65496 RepID=UPI0004AAB8E4|nr:hypothetical protein [Actinoalloteichus caeruleus]AUS77974.1 hypothetical protein C1701_05845 [Actinoalloteichus sp. AHMU CJ021]